MQVEGSRGFCEDFAEAALSKAQRRLQLLANMGEHYPPFGVAPVTGGDPSGLVAEWRGAVFSTPTHPPLAEDECRQAKNCRLTPTCPPAVLHTSVGTRCSRASFPPKKPKKKSPATAEGTVGAARKHGG